MQHTDRRDANYRVAGGRRVRLNKQYCLFKRTAYFFKGNDYSGQQIY